MYLYVFQRNNTKKSLQKNESSQELKTKLYGFLFAVQERLLGRLYDYLNKSKTTKDISRIRTFAFREIEKEQKKLFFPLDNITETCYIYSINETELEMNSNLISEIKESMDKDIISSFSIYPTSHQFSYAYAIYYTHFTQEV